MEEVVGWLAAILGGVVGGAIGFVLIAVGVVVAFMPMITNWSAERARRRSGVTRM